MMPLKALCSMSVNVKEPPTNAVPSTIATVDKWGKRQFAYEINHKTDGYYLVLEILAEGGALDELERTLRIADDIIRHKLIRLPEHEAVRRGLLDESGAVPATAG